MSPKRIGRRAIFLLSFIAAAFVVIGLRFWDLQVVHGARYQSLAQQDQLRKIPIPAPRGNIVTSDGVQVATSKPAWSLYYISQGGPLPSSEVHLLSQYLGMSTNTINKQIAQQLATLPAYQPIEIDSSLTPKQMTVIEENINHLPYLRIQPTAVRWDPYGSTMGNVLGFLGENTATADKGMTGLEAEYNNYLVGHSGGEYAEVNRQGQLVKLFGSEVPTPGDTLHLTINWNLEKTAYSALAYDMYAIQHASPSSAAYSPTANQGGVIAIDPNNGDILAIASLPSYNPNKLLPNSPSRNSYYAQLLKDPLQPLYDFIPIYQPFAPGSIFKPIMATSALAAGTLTPTTEIYDPGYFPKDPAFHNWYAPGFGWLNIVQALGLSDDTFFYTVGYDMGINLMDKWFKKFLLNKPTGIDLPGETTSTIPTPAQLKKDGDGVWTWGWNLNTAIGQGIDQFTLIALARADSAIANGGTLYKPHLVSEITTPKGKVVKKFNPVVQGKLTGVPSWVYSTVHQGMILSAQDPNIKAGVSGTGYGAMAGFPISVATKTGTAQRTGKPNDAFFLTYGPMPHPSILIIVYVKAGLWGAHSGFVARAIYDQYFHVKDPSAKQLFDTTFGKPFAWPYGWTPPAPKGP
ncbi:MAG: penicillin-binding transpeptidase domain-containing protein [Firmicutes bacterium]|nr:penicillin-binding transpeptidase domain-containing protein [Bacillota bacterium]